ncbi:MAG: autotransporter-associated beta strand repeat-containing protein, partial [Prosthecobacter sp.]|nr:autotransporter-associated beta strand repeat-containing protein [Prosthecobacter sp.]
LIFNGSTGGLVYAGSLRNGTLALGATSASTDRLFTLTGSGVTLSSTAANNNAIIWRNTGAIVHGTNADRTITLTGTSQGENTLNPQITDSTGFVTSVTKTGTGIWKLGNTNNTYSGDTTITQGILMATDGQGLSSISNLIFDGGTLFSQGALNRNIGTGPGEMQFKAPAANTAQFSGGFLGGESKLTVTWAGTPIWGSTTGFLDTRNGILLNGSQARAQGATGSIALSEVEIASDFSLGTASGAAASLTGVTTTSSSANLTVNSTAGLVVGQTISGTNIPSGSYIVSINSATGITISSNATASGSALTATVDANTLRPIRVDDNSNTGADYATLSGNISGNVGTGIRKLGSGTLRMTGDNTYNGETNINQGTLVVTTLGNSSVVGTSSVGTTANANLDSNAVTLGNTLTGGAILQYIGAGETSDRKIRLNSTTGSTQIHSDGTGPLILTNVANDMVAGAKTLFLRGTNTQGNMITSQLSDNGGTLGVTVDGSAVWILTNGANNYTGTTTSGAGALGIGHNTALGNSTLLLSNGNIFAYGADRTIANLVNLANNSTQGFLGDYSLTFSAGITALAAANNFGTSNNIATGKSLTINGVTANAMTANRSWTVDGSGETIVNGNITTSTAFGLVISKVGNGTLVLNGNASNFNQNNASLDIDRGTVRIGADNAIASAVGYGGVTISPELATLDTAIFDLNGHVQTINALTATTDGSVIIDNTSASPASFTFGANDATVNFGSGIGSYTIQNSGGGALSIYKAGNTSATFSAGMTLTHTGITGVTGGAFTIASALNGTSGFSVTGIGSTLSLTGGITDPTAVTSILVENGGTLRLLDGAGSQFSNLDSLTLGSSGGSMTTLGLNVGDSNAAGDNLNTDLLSLLNTGTLNLFAGNKITLDLTDAGLNPGMEYDLLTFAPGGFTSGVLNVNDWILGATPGGFDSITLTADNDRIYITTGALITGSLYWRGNTSNAWNGANNNWTTDKAGTTPGVTIPGQGTDVIFVSDPVGGAVVTTLEQNFKINSLTFESSTSTPSSVTIDPGTIATNRIEVAPQNDTDGIKISTGGPATVNINTAVKLGADQTWTVADAGSTLTISGSLLGEADIVKNGLGKVILGAAADPTFNSGTTSVVTINAGSFEMTNAGALGATANSNLAAVILNGGAFYYNNATSATIPNSLTLNGGTLSSGGNTQTYSSAIPITADSFINFRDSASALLTATARSVTLSGVLSGTGKLTLQSNNTLTAGNQESGTLTLTNDGNTAWSGGVLFEGGTIVTTAENALGTGDIVFDPFGRLIIRGTNGQTYNLPNDITFAGGSVGEISADNTSSTLLADFTVNLNGLVTIGSAAAPGIVRLELADTSSLMNLTGGVVLANDASISVGNGARIVTISSVISETGGARSLTINDDAGAWAQTNRTLRLTALNTFTGDIILSSGILEFDTVTNAGGAASSLGQGNTLTLGSATLGFIGSTSQSTNRAITTNGSPTLLANGTLGAIMTYTGAITQATNNSLTLGGAGEGVITGGITQPLGAATADITISSGTWTIQDSNVTTSDDLLINGGTVTLKDMVLSVNDDIVLSGSTAVLNLNTTGIWAAVNPAGTSSGLYARGGAIININADDVNGVGNANLTDFILLGDGTLAGVGTLNMNGFNITIPRLDVGAIAEGFEGAVIGTGTITATYTGTDYAQGFRLFRGSVSANLAGGSPILKQGLGSVTLSGDNSGLTGSVNATTRIDHGNLILDYTTYNTIKIPTNRGLDMRGGTLTINGSNIAATVQTVSSTTLASGGANTFTINPGAGQTATLTLGAITRAGSAGTLRINLPLADGFVTTTTANNSSHGLLGSSGFATVKDGNGQTWFARNDGANNIVGLTSSANNDVSTWVTGDHVTDETTGYVGSVSNVAINSLRFNAASAAGVNVLPTGVLSIASGGILMTDQVTTGTPGV